MTRRIVRWSLYAAVALGAVTSSSSCDGGPFGADAANEVTPIHVTAFAIGTPISTLVIEVTAEDIDQELVFNLELLNGVASGTIQVPAGEARTFSVTAYDDHHNVTHTGSETVDVNPRSNPPLRVRLKPVAGEVEIEVTFGDYAVLVTPVSATIDATITPDLQLEVTVLDQYGDTVNDPDVQWATTHPTVLRVSPSGLVTPLAVGEARVVATYAGVAGLSEIVVSDFIGSLGASCTNPLECTSGCCVDGVCCENLCEGVCMDCASGNCLPIAFYLDPDDECAGDGFCNGLGACAFHPDEYEPNNTFARAHYLGEIEHREEYRGSFDDPMRDANDFYRFRAVDPEGSCSLPLAPQFWLIEVWLDNIPSDSDYDLFLYDSEGTLLASSAHIGNGSETLMYIPEAYCWIDDSRDLVVRVQHISGDASDLQYVLNVYMQD